MTIILNQTDYNNALKLATTSYQRDLITGVHSLSGSTAPRPASKWKFSNGKDYNYLNDRTKLLKNLNVSSIRFRQIYGANNKRMFVFGSRGDTVDLFDLSENNFTNIHEVSENPFVLFSYTYNMHTKLKLIDNKNYIIIHKCLFLFKNLEDALMAKLAI